jgi:predicted transcriptional regulator YdeE
MAGIEINEANHNPQMQAVSINAGNYLVFKGVGEMPQAVIEAWENIWDYFSSSRLCYILAPIKPILNYM